MGCTDVPVVGVAGVPESHAASTVARTTINTTARYDFLFVFIRNSSLSNANQGSRSHVWFGFAP